MLGRDARWKKFTKQSIFASVLAGTAERPFDSA
jgi:hypothetical protein